MHIIVLNKIDYNQYAEGQDLEPEVVTTPVAIQASTIRCMYARKQNRPGSRITFADGGGFAVLESVEDILALLMSDGHRISIARAALPVTAQPTALPAPEGTTVN